MHTTAHHDQASPASARAVRASRLALSRALVPSPLGPITLVASANGLCGAWFEQQKHQPDTRSVPLMPAHPVLLEATAQLHRYFHKAASTHAPQQDFDLQQLPLDLGLGTAFEQLVWRGLLQLAAGTTCSYAGLAAMLGRPGAARAVGAAVGRNPIALIVPCHRVLGQDGRLTGYAAGLDRKAALLAHEGVRRSPPNRGVVQAIPAAALAMAA